MRIDEIVLNALPAHKLQAEVPPALSIRFPKSRQSSTIWRCCHNLTFITMSKKYYCVYLAYSKYEILTDEECANPNVPEYPPEVGRLRIYDNASSQMNTYANTMCPASQVFEADSIEEVHQKEVELKANFVNEEWLEKNIHPFV